MNKAAGIEHKLYEVRRSYENRQLTFEEKVIVRELEELSKLSLDEAWKEVVAQFASK